MQINVDNKGHETTPRVNFDFPISCGVVAIENYEGRRFLHHWHKEPEFTVIIKGELEYQVNDKIYHLTEGQGIFVNSGCLHSGWNEKSECIYIPINFAHWIMFDPEKSRIYKKYIQPIVSSQSFSCMVFDAKNNEDDSKILNLLNELYKLKSNKPEGYELKMMSVLLNILGIFLPKALHLIECEGCKTRFTKALARIKNAIDYIDTNYSEEIMLSDLASVTGFSTSEFCRCFKSIMRYTPMEYVTNIRIQKSLPLLAKHEHSITEIAEMCGFSGSSYFAEMFKKYMLCTPTQYAESKRHPN